MAEDSMKWGLRPAWRLAIAVAVGLMLTVVTLAWPAIVRGDSPPEILNVEVTSSKDTFFYSPPLGNSGGDTYFNNASVAQGAGQIITVTVVVSDDNPVTFTGGLAFGISPSTNISTSHGITSTWSVSYTIQSSHGSENNVLFTIIDGDGFGDIATISFIQDNTPPQLELVDVTDPQYDPDGNELNVTGNWYRTSALTAGWSFTATMTETGSGYDGGLATWNHTANNDNDQTLAPSFNDVDDTLNGTFTDVYTNSDGTVLFDLVATDRVGNEGDILPFALILDGTPAYAPPVSYLPDTDSGGDGFDPDTGYYDDPTIDATWSVASDGSGSGVVGYYLDTQTPPGTDLFYTGTSGVVTATGNYSDAYNLRVYITTLDKVGNIGNDAGQIAESALFLVREDPPSGNDITIQENTGGEYLYISDPTEITEGTLFYNNKQSSSFTVTGNTSFFTWGYNTPSWKVVFTPGWGELSADERFGAPYTHTYSIEPSVTTDVFTVYVVNRAGNVQGIAIDAVEDTDPPQVTLTDVTDPQYDPDGDKLNSDGNWYRTSLLGGGWAFTATTTDTGSGYASSLANWDHQDNDGDDQSITPDYNGADTLNGTFENVNTNDDGAVQMTVAATDYVSNVGTDTLRIQLDGTPPTINAIPWDDEDSPYLTVQGGVLYFNKAMPLEQTAVVSGTTQDAGSGLDHVDFEQKPNLTSDPVSQTTTGDWSSSYGFSSATDVGPDSVLVTIFDNVGNSANHAYNYVGLTDQPVIEFFQVTEPGYDLPPEDPLDDIGNWYAEGDLDAPSTPPLGDTGWWFYAVITPANSIDVAAAKATWDHEDGSLYSQTIDLAPSNDSVQDTFDDVAGNPSGLVAVTLTITDDISRMATDTLLIRIDKDGPAITDDGWTEDSPYLHVIGSTLFFSHQMGTATETATLSGHADDGPDGAGNNSVEFSCPDSLGFCTDDVNLPEWSTQYFVSNSSTDVDNSAQVTVRDNLLENQTVMTYPFVLDDIPPSTPTNLIITTPPVTPSYYNTQSLGLSWDASTDNVDGSGLMGYYLRANSSPTSFYPPTTTSATWNTGADGTFTFHLEARDNVANTSLTSTEMITVDTIAPVSVVTATADGRERRILVEWGADDPAPGTGAVRYDVQYSVTETGPWQPWLTGTTDTSAFFGPNQPIPVEFDTLYCYQVRAVDYVGNLGDWTQTCATLGFRQYFLPALLGESDISIPAAVFDGFETGAFVGWKTSGVLPSQIVSHPVPPVDGTPPNGGTYAARLGSPNYGCENVPVGRATIQAYASVPVSGTPFLRFDYRVLSYDTVQANSGEWWDRLEVRVNDEVLARYGDPDPGGLNCTDLYDSDWDQAEFDLSAYAGQTVVLTFFNENHFDKFYNTYSYLDNIRIEVD
jgi:hypothetical protein